MKMNPEDLKYAKRPKMNPELMNPEYLKTISQMSEKKTREKNTERPQIDPQRPEKVHL